MLGHFAAACYEFLLLLLAMNFCAGDLNECPFTD
jgi:hypothetical protein